MYEPGTRVQARAHVVARMTNLEGRIGTVTKHVGGAKPHVVEWDGLPGEYYHPATHLRPARGSTPGPAVRPAAVIEVERRAVALAAGDESPYDPPADEEDHRGRPRRYPDGVARPHPTLPDRFIANGCGPHADGHATADEAVACGAPRAEELRRRRDEGRTQPADPSSVGWRNRDSLPSPCPASFGGNFSQWLNVTKISGICAVCGAQTLVTTGAVQGRTLPHEPAGRKV